MVAQSRREDDQWMTADGYSFFGRWFTCSEIGDGCTTLLVY